MPITKRSPVTVLILSLVTCGIYTYYWAYVTADELQRASGRQQFSPVLILVLTIFFPMIGLVLLAIEANGCLSAIRAMRQMPPVDNTMLWVIIALLVSIADVPLIQNEINNVAYIEPAQFQPQGPQGPQDNGQNPQ